MKKIECSIATIKSLHAMSISGSDDVDEIDENIEINENDIAETVMSTSDEDFENLSPEDFEEALGDDIEEESKDEVNEDEPEVSAEKDGSEQTEDEDESEYDQPTDNSEDDNDDSENEDEEDNEYKKVYSQLFGAPIKASGREVKLRDADHARNLIEMGVDYNKKMQRMRPHMQALKTLEKEGLLDDVDQLNLLLEAKDGNQEAIKKLISQADIDVMDIADDDYNTAGDYQAGNRMVSEQEIAIGEVLSAIENSPKYNDTIDVMQNVFDQKSREIISDNPNYITALNQDIESGVYNSVMDTIQYKRDMNQVPAGVSDIELYISTVSELAKQEQSATTVEQSIEPTTITRRSSQASKKRKAGMSGSRGARKKKEPNFDPMDALSMSDDDFDKRFGDQLL